MLFILILYISLIFIISFRSAKDRKEENQRFFTAERKSNWLAVAFGMIGATLSGISVVSVPGMVASQSMTYMQMVFGFILGYFAVAYILLPLYYKLGLTSIYQYLEDRFGRFSHRSGAVIFLIYKLLSSAIKLYVVLIVLESIVLSDYGISFELGTIIVVAIIYLYTFRSGLSTVVITDCIQTLCLIVASVVLLFQAWSFTGLSFAETVSVLSESSYIRMFNFDDAEARSYFFKQFLSGIFIVVVMTGLDQDVMQKNLTCRDLKSAQKNMVLCGFCFTPVNLILLFTGALLFIGAEINGVVLPDSSDRVVPMFAEMFGTGATVCLIIGLMSASLSSADSAMVGLTTSFYFDILGKRLEEINPVRRRITHFVFAIVLVVLICVVKQMQGENALDIIYTVVSYLYAPLLGMYIFGMLTKRAVRDKLVPAVVLLTPMLMYALDVLMNKFYAYKFGYELLLVGAMFTMVGMFLISLNKTK